MANQNRKAKKEEIQEFKRTVSTAFPELEVVFRSHGDFGGHRVPRDHTIAFRLCDQSGMYCSNIVWGMPDQLSRATVAGVRGMVKLRNG